MSLFEESRSETISKQKVFFKSLLAGGLAGMSVDLALYPIDTVKTRIQSEQGFNKAGGFQGIYKGISAVCVGSIPASSLFFVSYEVTKAFLEPKLDEVYHPLLHMFAACLGETTACLVRVPTDIVKQRRQVGNVKSNILVDAFRTEGLYRGVFRGFGSTVLRDLPFSLIQMPLWELIKRKIAERRRIGAAESALSGALAGGIAAALTTPMDLAKTRIMLAKSGKSDEHLLKVLPVLRKIYAENGYGGLYAGIIPRTTLFMIGGFVFFGAYEYFGKLFETVVGTS